MCERKIVFEAENSVWLSFVVVVVYMALIKHNYSVGLSDCWIILMKNFKLLFNWKDMISVVYYKK